MPKIWNLGALNLLLEPMSVVPFFTERVDPLLLPAGVGMRGLALRQVSRLSTGFAT